MVEVKIGSFIFFVIAVFILGLLTGVVLQQRVFGTEDVDERN